MSKTKTSSVDFSATGQFKDKEQLEEEYKDRGVHRHLIVNCHNSGCGRDLPGRIPESYIFDLPPSPPRCSISPVFL